MGVENNVPESWVETTLGDQSLEVLNGYAFKSKNFTTNKINESYLPVLKIKNVANGDANHKDVVFHILSKETEKYVIKKGDVLIALTGNHPFAKTQVVGGISKYRLNKTSLLNQRVAKLNAGNPNKLSDSFIYYFFKWSNTQFHIGNQSSGSASQANISKNDILNIPLNLPPLSEQKAITKVLTAFDDKIELLQAQNKTLETMAQTIFKGWFGKYQIGDELPEGWRVGRLKDLGNIICGKTPSKADNENFGGNIPFIKIPDMHNKMFIITTTDSLTKKGVSLQKNKLIPKNSICVSCIATVGLVSITSKDSQTNQQINSIIPFNDSYKEFIYFKVKGLNKYLHDIGSGGTATLNVNTTSFSNIEIVIPDAKKLYSFSKITNPIFKKVLDNDKQIQSLTKTRDTLLPKLMSGQVRVKNIKHTADA